MWLQHGVDIHTVQSYLAHQRIETTTRYRHFVEDYVEKVIRNAREREPMEARKLENRGRQMGDTSLRAGTPRKVGST